MMALCISHAWGPAFVYFTWSLWWLDALLSMAVCTSMPFVVMSRHQPSLDAITAALLLPIVPAVVAAASGALVGRVLLDSHLPAYAFTTLVASYVLWGVGISFSACVLALYFLRLTVHSLPPREVIVSVMLPIGPMGQGGFGIQKLGALAVDVLPAHAANSHIFPVLLTGSDTAAAATAAAQVLYVLGVLFGLLMWATGIVWLAYALSSIATTKSFPFNMGWWGFTFPIGVLATCTGALATNLDSAFFRVFTMMLSISVVALWAVVAVRTVFVVGHGDVFPAPCLKDLKDRE